VCCPLQPTCLLSMRLERACPLNLHFSSSLFYTLLCAAIYAIFCCQAASDGVMPKDPSTPAVLFAHTLSLAGAAGFCMFGVQQHGRCISFLSASCQLPALLVPVRAGQPAAAEGARRSSPVRCEESDPATSTVGMWPARSCLAGCPRRTWAAGWCLTETQWPTGEGLRPCDLTHAARQHLLHCQRKTVLTNETSPDVNVFDVCWLQAGRPAAATFWGCELGSLRVTDDVAVAVAATQFNINSPRK